MTEHIGVPAVAPESVGGDDDEPDSLGVDVIDDDQFLDHQWTERLCRAVRSAARDQQFHQGSIAVLVTDDESIRSINRDHLDHDYATDVISFGYQADADSGLIEGELVISHQTARLEAKDRRLDARDEVILYAVHGTLHIAGLKDHDDVARQNMRSAERRVLLSSGYCEDVAADIVGVTS